ncbi:MAG: hypothetical protein LBR80_08065, partial [Deltaproteobacteria bacterium]|nr:hypothetical protein [Deltaproteobacteria bacterium]
MSELARGLRLAGDQAPGPRSTGKETVRTPGPGRGGEVRRKSPEERRQTALPLPLRILETS